MIQFVQTVTVNAPSSTSAADTAMRITLPAMPGERGARPYVPPQHRPAERVKGATVEARHEARMKVIREALTAALKRAKGKPLTLALLLKCCPPGTSGITAAKMLGRLEAAGIAERIVLNRRRTDWKLATP